MSTRLSFLDPPGEIRNLIYRYALVSEDPIAAKFRPSKLALNLLLTNKKSYHEARFSLRGHGEWDAGSAIAPSFYRPGTPAWFRTPGAHGGLFLAPLALVLRLAASTARRNTLIVYSQEC
jgi:hypothetical protein